MGVGYPGGAFFEEMYPFKENNNDMEKKTFNIKIDGKLKDFLKENFPLNEEKTKKLMDELYEQHGKANFESDVYKLYDDIINVVKKPVSAFVPKKIVDYPLTNVYEVVGNTIVIDVICPGINKQQLDITIETVENKTFLCVKGMPWYNMSLSSLGERKYERIDIEIGDVFNKKYDITHYNIDLNKISSEYKDGILSVYLTKKPIEDKSKQNFKIEIK